jgi:hypothetical protein
LSSRPINARVFKRLFYKRSSKTEIHTPDEYGAHETDQCQ